MTVTTSTKRHQRKMGDFSKISTGKGEKEGGGVPYLEMAISEKKRGEGVRKYHRISLTLKQFEVLSRRLDPTKGRGPIGHLTVLHDRKTKSLQVLERHF